MTQTKERGILFTGWSIPKIMDQMKTQTRRTYGLEKVNNRPQDYVFVEYAYTENGYRYIFNNHQTNSTLVIKCPYGQVGDRLWLKETFSTYPTHYRADGYELQDGEGRWHPSIFMPRRVSRIDLEITDVRAERLQNISWRDIQAEGVTVKVKHAYDFDSGEHMPEENYRRWLRVGFRDLWDSLNPKYPFDFNPWVWAIGFKVSP